MSDPRLLKRLRTSLGLTGLSLMTIGSGPCGSCPNEEPYTTCERLREIAEWREKALAWTLDQGLESPCFSLSGGGGSGGEGGAPTSNDSQAPVLSEDGVPLDAYDVCAIRKAAERWTPEDGCPDAETFSDLAMLKAGRSYRSYPLDSSEPSEEQCCYHSPGGPGQCPGGRPFLVAGEARTARPPSTENVVSAVDRELGRLWLELALSEHASVAAFARLSLQLLHLGAPMALVVDAQRASLDEARHAAFCAEEAERRLDVPVVLGALDVRGALDELDAASLLVTNVVEGCIGETLAAAQALRRAEIVDDDGLSRRIRRLGRDEERHAALAWRVLEWLLTAVEPNLRAAAMNTFLAHAPVAPSKTNFVESAPDSSVRNPAGLLTPTQTAHLDRETWDTTIVPLALELLHGRRTATPREVAAVPEPESEAPGRNERASSRRGAVL